MEVEERINTATENELREKIRLMCEFTYFLGQFRQLDLDVGAACMRALQHDRGRMHLFGALEEVQCFSSSQLTGLIVFPLCLYEIVKWLGDYFMNSLGCCFRLYLLQSSEASERCCQFRDHLHVHFWRCGL